MLWSRDDLVETWDSVIEEIVIGLCWLAGKSLAFLEKLFHL